MRPQENTVYPTQTELANTRRNFMGGLWHGAFLALGVSLTQEATVISAFVADLTGSTVWVGVLSNVLTVAAAIPQFLCDVGSDPARIKCLICWRRFTCEPSVGACWPS